jgi:outer membrane protein assembly factor BamB
MARLLLLALAGLLLVTPFLPAQIRRDRIFSRPEIPSKEALARLNLRLGWRAYVPTDGGKDTIVRVELNGKDLIALTRSGTVQRMDAETGRVHWRVTVGKPYTMLPFIAANNRSIYIIANAKLFGLDRVTGRQKWVYDVPGGISASPAVDEEQIYVPNSTTQLRAFYLPFVTEDTTDSPGEITRRSAIYGGDLDDRSPRPKPTWSELTNIQLTFKPLQTPETLFVISPSGKALGFAKIPREGASTTELYALSTDGKIRVPPSSFGDTAYIGSDDAALYAVNMMTGKLRWRHTAGTPITRTPAATAKDVYVTSDREGLARIDRESGDAMWRIPSGRSFTNANPLADRFLAANNRFVYASDSSGRLLVLDHKRGVRLSMLDTRDFRVPVVNELTDRLYLAANDGLIVCLHDRDQVEPIRHRKSLEDANSPVLKLLDAKINEVGGKEVTFREAIADLRKKYKIKIDVAGQAFQNAKLDDPNEKKVTPPRSENKTLKDHLQRLLKPLGATYIVVDQVILIVPGKG